MNQPLSRRHVLAAAGAAFGAGLMPRPVRAVGAERLVVAGGALTEIVAALGAGDRIVGVDDTSLHPPALVRSLPKIGYLRTLAAEGILSLDPSLVIATDQAGPPPVIGQLRAVGTKLLIVPEGKRLDAALEMIACLGALREGLVPPTIGYREADPACDLDVTPNEARRRPVRVALSNAFAFGGTNVTVALRKFA